MRWIGPDGSEDGSQCADRKAAESKIILRICRRSLPRDSLSSERARADKTRFELKNNTVSVEFLAFANFAKKNKFEFRFALSFVFRSVWLAGFWSGEEWREFGYSF